MNKIQNKTQLGYHWHRWQNAVIRANSNIQNIRLNNTNTKYIKMFQKHVTAQFYQCFCLL